MSTNLWRQVRDKRDMSVLVFLDMPPKTPMTQIEIGRCIGVHPSVVCRIVKRLRAAGLVEKVVDGVKLTPKGRKKLS